MGHRMGAFSIIGLLIAWQVFGGLYVHVWEFALRALYGLL
jgi:hypothetical protein